MCWMRESLLGPCVCTCRAHVGLAVDGLKDAVYDCFFFFQAEDGIRDDLVTGVQTCALPIYSPCRWLELRSPRSSERLGSVRQAFLFAAIFIAVVGPTLVAPIGTASSWALSGELAQPRAYASAVTLPTGEIFVFGGLDEHDPEVVSTTTELIQPLTGDVRTLPQRLPGRLHHTVTLGWGDRVVVAGGVLWFGGGFHSTDRVDVYLPYQRQWIHAAPLLTARSDHGAAALPHRQILVTGGDLDVRPLPSSEIYHPPTH